MTGLTTIKVASATRDQLKAQASRADLTLGQYLDALARRGEREARFARLKAQIAATSPADRDSWSRETSGWERAELADSVTDG